MFQLAKTSDLIKLKSKYPLISTHKSSAYTGHISFPELEKKEFEKSDISYKGEKYTLY
ncbi:MAG: hypothetical protein MGG11_15035 [Trichodesmium sp. MAG_R03]|jgi:hypothetical protein|nr:hypothetical protein [Trichodesmium sp. MAG_R03]